MKGELKDVGMFVCLNSIRDIDRCTVERRVGPTTAFDVPQGRCERT